MAKTNYETRSAERIVELERQVVDLTNALDNARAEAARHRRIAEEARKDRDDSIERESRHDRESWVRTVALRRILDAAQVLVSESDQRS